MTRVELLTRARGLTPSMLGDLAAGAVAGLAVAMPVGAIGAYLLGLAARERFAVAAAAALGVASVDGAYALVASLGGAGCGRWSSRRR